MKAKAQIFIEDNEDGTLNVGADFGDAIDNDSQAHQMAQVLLNSILTSAKTFIAMENTVPDVNVEPSRIITASGTNEGLKWKSTN